MGFETVNDRSFMVQNGGNEDEQFDGKHRPLPVLLPGTMQSQEVRFYISPHNNAPYDIIVGYHDLNALGFTLARRVAENVVLFRNDPTLHKP